MVFVEVCVGSSCHLKGAPEIVQWLQKRIADNHLEDEIVLSGSFCTGKCNRVGVTVTVNSTIHTGITVDSVYELWETAILPATKTTEEGSV